MRTECRSRGRGTGVPRKLFRGSPLQAASQAACDGWTSDPVWAGWEVQASVLQFL